MNPACKRNQLWVGVLLAVAVIVMVGYFVLGAGIQTLLQKLSSAKLVKSEQWEPSVAYGEIMWRELPTASKLTKSHLEWVRSSPKPTAHVYKVRLSENGEISNYRHNILKGKWKLIGGGTWTFISFHYHDPVNGKYEMSYQIPGAHEAAELSFTNGMQLAVQVPNPDSTNACLQIVGIEGLKPWGSAITTFRDWHPAFQAGQGTTNRLLELKTPAVMSDTNLLNP